MSSRMELIMYMGRDYELFVSYGRKSFEYLASFRLEFSLWEKFTEAQDFFFNFSSPCCQKI